jgi:hypothetical protein
LDDVSGGLTTDEQTINHGRLTAELEGLRVELEEAREAQAHARLHARLASATARAASVGVGAEMEAKTAAAGAVPGAPAALAAEAAPSRTGRWLWKGELVAGGGGKEVEWTNEALRPAPEVLAWSADAPAHVVARAPGLYSLRGAVFARGGAEVALEVRVDGAVVVVVGSPAGAAGAARRAEASRVAPRAFTDTLLSLPAGAVVAVALRWIAREGGGGEPGRRTRRAGAAFLELAKV